MDPISFVRASFLIVAASLLVLVFVPPLQRFASYGARANAEPASSTADKKPTSQPGILEKFLAQLNAVKVPHSWFWSFYATSVASSIFWMGQILLRGWVFELFAERVHFGQDKGMGLQQVLVIWGLMLAQGSRRLYECLYVSKQSQSQMHFAHWALGIWFYLMVGVCVWIEGIPALQERNLHYLDLHFQAPSLKSFVAVLLYLLAAGAQHDCHAYLASLKTYTVPSHPAFNQVVCPHYFAECAIYLALTIGAAPAGYVFNRSFLCALIFVVVNLGATADNAKKWYANKFGPSSVQSKWRMLPFIF